MKVWGKLKANTGHNAVAAATPTKKDQAPPTLTPLQKLLQDAGPLRPDGSDKFYGMENPQYANVCYCNSIIQCLYYSVPFRDAVMNYPRRSPQESLQTSLAANLRFPDPNAPAEDLKPKPPPPVTARSPGLVLTAPPKPEDKDSPEYKKKVATNTLPVLETKDNASAYGMQESLFTALKDIFEALAASPERMGILKLEHFLGVLRKKYETFKTAQHQDAHEFLNILLNEVVSNVEAETKRIDTDAQSHTTESAASTSLTSTTATNGTKSLNTARWVHELFEGTLTSETQCLTCEKVSQRDEVFLDLSVDLEQHASVTACLRKFSEEEMLCEKNKFHCDTCGGLQEAEKRMKIKRLPRVLALHLKRFKYTEENQQQRLQKLFHRVVYPYHLRLFNTTDDTEDPDRLYELYAVVVHIGGGPYHGHYVAIIKTEDRGWLLFDDEMVEPVDKNYVRNFFGDRPGQACAYVLFYQETTFEAMQEEISKEGVPREREIPEVKEVPTVHKMNGTPIASEVHRAPASEDLPKAQASPPSQNAEPSALPPIPAAPKSPFSSLSSRKSAIGLRRDKGKEAKEAKEKEAKEEKERKISEKAAEKEKEKAEKAKRKEREAMIRNEQKRLEAEMKAAIQASKESKAEDDRRASEPSQKENGTTGHHGAFSHGLGRFMSRATSVSHSKSKKRTENRGHAPEVPPVPADTNAKDPAKAKGSMDKSNGRDDTEGERRDTVDEPGRSSTTSKFSRFKLTKRSFSMPGV